MQEKTKIALVTGGSRGLGKSIALHLAKNGHDVMITYRGSKSDADAVVEEIITLGQKAAAFQLEVTQSQTFDNFFNEVSSYLEKETGVAKFDFLINNAGFGADALISNTEEGLLDTMYNVHVKGVYFLTQKALPYLNNDGRIVNISSALTRFADLGYAAYAMMKGAIDVFTKYAAKELGARGITVNAVAPGLIETDLTKDAFDNPYAVEAVVEGTALGRTGKPDDIGGIVAFLCSKDAGWITGQRIEATGGVLL
jgi:NAD(P)-dependent dehydrogenase (short-subunit alcohol dehydrogenase family)